MPPRRDECLAIMESAGQSFPDRVAEGVAMDHCSHWFLLAAAVDGAGTPLSLQTAVRAIEDLGESHAGTSTYVNRFGPERHAGAAAYRPLAYDDSCECWQFTGGLSPM